jgi:hypothetical protein
MKTVQRIRRNSRTIIQSSQVQPNRNGANGKADSELADKLEWQQYLESEFGKPTPGKARGACVAIVDLNEMAPVEKIPLTEAEWSEIYMMNVQERGSVNFILSAIREKLHQDDFISKLRGLANSLNHCVKKSAALNQLVNLSDENDEEMAKLMGNNNGGRIKRNDDLDAGITLLNHSVMDEFSKISDAIMKMAYSKPEAKP